MAEQTMALAEVNKAVVRRIYDEGYNQGDPSVYDELYHPDFVHHSKIIHDVPRGSAGEKESMIRFRRAIPDVHFTVLDQLADGDLVACRIRITGTPVDQYGYIGPDSGVFEREAMVLFRVQDGRAIEQWFFVNAGTELTEHPAGGS